MQFKVHADTYRPYVLAVAAVLTASLLSMVGPAPASAGTTDVDLVAVTGTDHRLYVRKSTETAYRNLGGYLLGPPSVTVNRANGRAYYVGQGSDGRVFVRTDTLGWKAFVASGTCAQPDATVAAGVLVVACRSSQGRMLVAKAVLGSGLPAAAAWKDYGGALLGGPSVSASAGSASLDYHALGTDNRVYARTDTSGFKATAGVCSGAPEVAQSATGIVLTCLDGAKALTYLQVVPQGTWRGNAGGVAMGRPGVSLDGDGSFTSYVIGGDGAVLRREFTSGGKAGASSGWGGKGLGLSAVHLTPAYPARPAGTLAPVLPPPAAAQPFTVTAAAPSTAQRGTGFRVTGSVSPASTGSVELQRYTGSTWATVGTGGLSGNAFDVGTSDPGIGVQRYRVRKAAEVGASAGTSAELRVRVTSSTLRAGETLAADDYLTSSDGRYRLVMQSDGNLVQVVARSGRPLWSTRTTGAAGARLVMQSDGNAVVYDSSSRAVWSTGSGGTGDGHVLALQDDANVVNYDSAQRPVWASSTVNDRLATHEVLTVGQTLRSVNGTYTLIMQGDGNLVQYGTSGAVWSTRTTGQSSDARLVMQDDGNAVVYGPGALWQSGTGGRSAGGELVVQNDANVVVYGTGVGATWSSNTATGGDLRYRLPWTAGTSIKVTQGPGGSYSHNLPSTRYGVDFGMSLNTTVRASAPGVVRIASNRGDGFGNTVWVDHGGGACTIYAHLNTVAVSVGQQVGQAHVLGGAGTTGHSTGVHLHWGKMQCGTYTSLPVSTVETGSTFPEGASLVSQNNG